MSAVFVIRLAVAATDLILVDFCVLRRSNHLDRYVMGHFHGFKVWVKTLFIMSFLYMYERTDDFENLQVL